MQLHKRLHNLIKPRFFAIFFLGFCSGLPLLLVFGTFFFWLREAGIARSQIGLLSLIGLIYSLKFIWAPFLDRYFIPLPGSGRRKAWLYVALVAVVLGLTGLACNDPQDNLTLTVVFALLTALASATLDIVVDAFRIESAPVRLQAMMTAVYQTGYRLAMFVASAGALMLAAAFADTFANLAYDYAAWRLTYLIMAGIMACGLIVVFFVKEPIVQAPTVSSSPSTSTFLTESVFFRFINRLYRVLHHMFVPPFTDFIKRYAWYAVLILLLVASYRIADIVLGVMANPFYVDMGFSKVEVASVAKSYGIAVTLLGSFAGGLLVMRYNLLAIMLIGAILTAITNLLFAALAVVGHNLWGLIAVISADNFSAGLATSAFIAYLSSLTNLRFTASQYALLSSLMLILPKSIAGFSGFMVDSMGYETFFLLSAAMGLPAVILIGILMLMQGRQTLRT